MVAEKMEAMKSPKANTCEEIAPANGLRAMAASFASLITIPFTCNVDAQATIIKKATTTVAVQPTMISIRVYLYSFIFSPFSMTDDCI